VLPTRPFWSETITDTDAHSLGGQTVAPNALDETGAINEIELNASAEPLGYTLDPPQEQGVYLLAIERNGQHTGYYHARHYLGWSAHIADRVAAHRRGTGARFTQFLVEHGYGLWLVAWWPGDRELERLLKFAHHAPRLCPLCRAGRCVVDQAPQWELDGGWVVDATPPDAPTRGNFQHTHDHASDHASDLWTPQCNGDTVAEDS